MAKSSQKKTILHKFLNTYPNACFYHIGAKTAALLKREGYAITILGSIHRLNLSDYDITWRTHPSLKRSINVAKREGVVIKELQNNAASWDEIQSIHKKWLQQKPLKRELQFLCQPLEKSTLFLSRVFGAYDKNTLVGFKTYSPMHKEGLLSGYYQDMCRLLPNAPQGSGYLISNFAIETFKKESIPMLSLGLVPFKLSKQKRNLLFSSLYTLTRPIYNCKGLYEHKRRFHGEETPCYLASRKKLPIRDLWTAFGLMTGLSQRSALQNEKSLFTFQKRSHV